MSEDYTLANLMEQLPALQQSNALQQARTFMLGKSSPVVYYPVLHDTLLSVPKTEQKEALELLAAAEIRLVWEAQKALDEAIALRREKNTKAPKPADLYRKYSRHLRSIAKRNGQSSLVAHELLTTLYLEQTLSAGELENPDYVDGYTGEAVDKPVELTVEQLKGLVPANLLIARSRKWVQEAIKFLGWTYETGEILMRTILSVHQEIEGFVPVAGIVAKLQAWATLEDMDEEIASDFEAWVNTLQGDLLASPVLVHDEAADWAAQATDELQWDAETRNRFLNAQGGFSVLDYASDVEDDRGFVPETLAKDYVLDNALINGSWPLLNAFNSFRGEVFAEMRQEEVARNLWHATFVQKFAGPAVENLVNYIADVAMFDATTAGVIYLRVQGKYGLTERHIGHIPCPHNSPANLVEYVNDHQDGLLETMNDGGLYSASEIYSIPMVETTTEETRQALRERLPKYDENPLQTADWNIGYVDAISGGADLKSAEASAWSAWRLAMSKAGAEAYARTYAACGNRKKAMSAFWSKCDAIVPRPQQKIKSIAANKMGLVLEGGRVIDWRLAAIKARNHELFLKDGVQERLVAKLTELGIGQVLLNALK